MIGNNKQFLLRGSLFLYIYFSAVERKSVDKVTRHCDMNLEEAEFREG